MAIVARPTSYKGIAMRSRLEAGFAQHLDLSWGKGNWAYEPEAFADGYCFHEEPECCVVCAGPAAYENHRVALAGCQRAMEEARHAWDKKIAADDPGSDV